MAAGTPPARPDSAPPSPPLLEQPRPRERRGQAALPPPSPDPVPPRRARSLTCDAAVEHARRLREGPGKVVTANAAGPRVAAQVVKLVWGSFFVCDLCLLALGTGVLTLGCFSVWSVSRAAPPFPARPSIRREQPCRSGLFAGKVCVLLSTGFGKLGGGSKLPGGFSHLVHVDAVDGVGHDLRRPRRVAGLGS